jgi:hypothetical protein
MNQAAAKVVDVPGVDVANLLSGMSKKPAAKKSKSKVHVVGSHEDLADRAVARIRAEKQAKTEAAMAKQEVCDTARKEYERRARAGDFSKAIAFAGNETNGVRVSFSDSFLSLPDKEVLIEHLGEERFGQLFTERRHLALKRDKTDDASIVFLLDRLGQETFAEYFDVEIAVEAKPGLDRNQFELPDAVRSMVVQKAPSVAAA